MNRSAPRRSATPFGVVVRGLAASWVALLLLMSASLALSYLHLGSGNVVAAIAIACIKTAIVGAWFMHLRRTSATGRAAGAIALFMLAILLGLAGIDYLSRLDEPADVQAPTQIEPAVSPASVP